MAQQDFRARLQPKGVNTPSTSGSHGDRYGWANTVSDILGPRDQSNILYPLYSTNGVLFPYTPAVTGGNTAEYDDSTHYIHSNYGYNAYVRSYAKPISIDAAFTAQSNDEALYLLAVMHFFRSVTKSYFGINPYNKAGTPPPVLVFNYLGDYQYNNVPVIVKDFSYTLDANIDYVPVDTSGALDVSANMGVSLPLGNNGGFTWVPTYISIKIELDTQYTPIDLRNNFNLDKFRSGALINKGYI